jgi:hypothetical protein
MTDDPVLIAILLGTIALAAFVNGTIGFGFALLAVNALALVLGAKDGVVVMSLLAPFVSALQLISHRAFAPAWRRLAGLLAGALVGSVVGTQLLVILPGSIISVALGLFTLWFVARSIRGERPPMARATERRLGPLAGFVGGVSNGTLGASGPVFGTYLAAIGLRGRDFAYAISLVFFVMAVLRIGLLAALDQYTTPLVLVAGLLLVPSLGVQWIGLRFRGRLPTATIYRGVLIALGVGAATLIWRGVDGLSDLLPR